MGAAANKTWTARCAILAGALEHDPMRLCIAKSFLNEVFMYVDTAGEDMGDGGFYTDGSFVQHGVSPYTGGYGVSLINELSNIMYFLQGTNFLFNGDDVSNQYDWIFNSFRPIMYGDNLFASTRGREVNRKTSEREVFDTTVISMIKMQSYAPAEYKDKLISLIRYFMLNAKSDYTEMISPDLMDFCAELYANDSVTLPEPYINAKVLANMDRVVQHGPSYGVCLSLSSTRMHKYESINGENKTAWYHGDGMIYIYTDDYDYNYDYFWYANPYRMPGVTANTSERVVTNIHPTIPNANAYAGGVAQGKYAASGFILEYDPNQTRGTFADENGWTIQAKKSYFFFDNEIICVGSDISDKSGSSVQTTVENRIWREDDIFTVGNESVEPILNVETTLSDRVMHFTNMGGYVILKDYGASLKYLKTEASGDEKGYMNSSEATQKRSFLEIVLDHGVGNTSSGKLDSNKYFYAYLPESDVTKTNEYAQDADVDLLSISGSHAVIEKKLGIVACNFFGNNGTLNLTASGMPNYSAITSLTSVSTDRACSVMVTKNTDGSYTVSVSDPTQLSSSIKLDVAISGISQVVSADNGISATVENGVAKITANTNGSMGATFSITLK
jgi:hyaluronate lyase